MFSYQFCEIFKSNFFAEHLPTIASAQKWLFLLGNNATTFVYCFTGSPQFAVFLVNSLNAKVAIIPFNELQFNELIVNLRHEVFLMSLLCIYHIFSESCVICRCWKSMLFWFQHWCYQKALFCRWLGIEKMLRKLEFYEKLCMKI